MKRVLSLILIFTLLLSGCGKDTPATAPTETGSIPTAAPEATVPTTQGPEGILDEQVQTIYVLTRFTHMDGEGNLNWYQEYEYDDRGNQIAMQQFQENGYLSYEVRSTLDENGSLTLAENYQDGELVSTTRYAYDSRGNVILDSCTSGDQLLYEIAYTYDDHDNILTMEMTTTGEITQSLAFSYSYDAAGNILTREEYMDGEFSTRTEMTYDSQNRCLTEVIYDAAGEIMSTTQISWEGTTETRYSYDVTGELYLTEISTYDDSGNITFRENQYAGGQVTQNEYHYTAIEIKDE